MRWSPAVHAQCSTIFKHAAKMLLLVVHRMQAQQRIPHLPSDVVGLLLCALLQACPPAPAPSFPEVPQQIADRLSRYAYYHQRAGPLPDDEEPDVVDLDEA